jgi:hypothetical protein
MISDLEKRLELYCKMKGRAILQMLGGGTDGTVWETTNKTAIKILIKAETYANELEWYRRLLRYNITEIQGFVVPSLVDYNNELLAIEIHVVQPPRILDFGKVKLDAPWDYSAQTLADWREAQQELWGDYWPTIKRILWKLESLGIYYSDPNPYNITPEDWNPEL